LIETTELLQAYADLILRLSGAGSVGLVMTGVKNEEQPTVVAAGEVDPVDELRDPESIRRLEAEFAERCASCAPDALDCPLLWSEASDAECVLLRVPIAQGAGGSQPTGVAERRRVADGRPCSELAVWLGLRYASDSAASRSEPGLLKRPFDAEGEPSKEAGGWWKHILGLAAALAAHSHAISRVLEDPLTGLPTRAGFRTEFSLSLDRARLNGRPLALVLINPDGFADVNRRGGRAVGDAVLTEVAERLRASVRSSDRVARYGGATLGAVLADVSPMDAERLADTIRTNLGAAQYCDGQVSLEFSSGMVSIDPTREDDEGDPVTSWIRRADEAMLQAKLEGGARGCTWSSDAGNATGRTVDRLQGMFTGDVNTDYRNMAMLWEVLQSIADGGEPEDLCHKVTERLQIWLPARIIAVVEPGSDGQVRVLSASVDGAPPTSEWTLHPEAIDEITRALDAGEEQIAVRGEGRGAGSSRAMPLIVEGRVTGCIYLQGDDESRGRDAPDPRFFAALAAQLAIVLDRARLHALERARDAEKQEILKSEVRELRRVLHSTRLAYTSDSMRAVLETARKIAPTDATVLITGESGTGKELLARTVHQLGDRRDHALIVVDCGAISASLIESELFGHEKGAFTGASARKIGRLAQADGATVFLDEISELPIDVQSRLLRFVQEKTVVPVGGTRPQKIDARIIAATNVDLAQRVRAGTFRQDLFHRLNVVQLRLPPLRERKGDILHLASIFLQQYAALYRKDGLRLAQETERELLRRPWTGNVRELQNRIMRAVLFAEGDVIRPEDLDDGREDQPEGVAAEIGGSAPAASAPDGSLTPEEQLRDALEREVDLALSNGFDGRPLGKWLGHDLVIAADRITGGIARQGGTLLGLADTTYRRRLAEATRERDSALAVRSETWDDVRWALDAFVSSRREAGGDLASRAERIVLQTIVHRCGDDVRKAAQLFGVTEPTYLKRLNKHAVGKVPA